MIKAEKKIYLSLIVPLYNEAANVSLLAERILSVIKNINRPCEVIFVDDGSTDGTRDKLRRLATEYTEFYVILFRANFGQSAAMAAGFEASRGEVIVAMDGDLQNDPADIPVLLDKLEQGYDVVSGWRKDRKDKLIGRKIPSKIANRLICSITDVKLHDTGCSLKAFRGDVLRSISLYGEMHRFIPALMRIEGANIAEIPVRHHPRIHGSSKYNLTRTFRVLMDLTTLRLFMKHLHNPLGFFAAFSFFCLIGGILALTGMIVHFQSPEKLNILITIAVMLLSSSLMFIFLGLIGKMITNSGGRKAYNFDVQ